MDANEESKKRLEEETNKKKNKILKNLTSSINKVREEYQDKMKIMEESYQKLSERKRNEEAANSKEREIDRIIGPKI